MELANLKLPHCFQVGFNPTESVVNRSYDWKQNKNPVTKCIIHNAVVCVVLPLLSAFGACYHAALGVAKLAIVAAETPVVILSGRAIPYIAQSDISVETSGQHFREALDLIIQIVADPIFNHTLARASDSNPYLYDLLSKVHELKNSTSRLDRVKCQAITLVAVPTVAVVGALLQPLFIVATLGLCVLTLPLQLSGDRSFSRRHYYFTRPESAAWRVRLIAKSIITAIATPLLSLYKTDKVLEFNQKLDLWIPPRPPAPVSTLTSKAIKVTMSLTGKVLEKAFVVSLYAVGAGLIGYAFMSCIGSTNAISDRKFYKAEDRTLAKFVPDISELVLNYLAICGLITIGEKKRSHLLAI